MRDAYRQDSCCICNLYGGFLFEDDKPVILTQPIELMALGRETIIALKGSQTRPVTSITRYKLTDWPAFKVSEISSVRRFEQEYIQIHASGANEYNLAYVIDGKSAKDSELHVVSSISSGVQLDKLGERIKLVYRACCDRRV